MKKFNDSLFKPTLTSVRLSPAFIFNMLCGVTLLADLFRDSDTDNGVTTLRLLFAFRFIVPSFQRARINYSDYQYASRLLNKYGYRTKWAKHFLDSTCGRAQLNLACKEQGFLNKYFEHIKSAGVRWYHID